MNTQWKKDQRFVLLREGENQIPIYFSWDGIFFMKPCLEDLEYKFYTRFFCKASQLFIGTDWNFQQKEKKNIFQGKMYSPEVTVINKW